MAGTTEHLGLALLGVSAEDKSVTFEEWRTSINGDHVSSNMSLIDQAFGEHAQQIAELASAIGGIFSNPQKIEPYTNFNNLQTPGMYVASSMLGSILNQPSSTKPFVLTVLRISSTYLIQVVITTDKDIYIRTLGASGWEEWTRAYTSSNKPTCEDIDAAASDHEHSNYALADHTHDDEYAAVDHGHTGVYAVVDHGHAGVYAESNHGHNLVDLGGTLSIEKGGTGATSASNARTALGITPANIGAATSGHTHAFTEITGTLQINKGGTGATTVAAARNALGLGNTSGALPIANGGTGATTAAAARTAIGAAASSHTHTISEVGIVYSTSTPSGAAGKIWLKPIE